MHNTTTRVLVKCAQAQAWWDRLPPNFWSLPRDERIAIIKALREKFLTEAAESEAQEYERERWQRELQELHNARIDRELQQEARDAAAQFEAEQRREDEDTRVQADIEDAVADLRRMEGSLPSPPDEEVSPRDANIDPASTARFVETGASIRENLRRRLEEARERRYSDELRQRELENQRLRELGLMPDLSPDEVAGEAAYKLLRDAEEQAAQRMRSELSESLPQDFWSWPQSQRIEFLNKLHAQQHAATARALSDAYRSTLSSDHPSALDERASQMFEDEVNFAVERAQRLQDYDDIRNSEAVLLHDPKTDTYSWRVVRPSGKNTTAIPIGANSMRISLGDMDNVIRYARANPEFLAAVRPYLSQFGWFRMLDDAYGFADVHGVRSGDRASGTMFRVPDRILSRRPSGLGYSLRANIAEQSDDRPVLASVDYPLGFSIANNMDWRNNNSMDSVDHVGLTPPPKRRIPAWMMTRGGGLPPGNARSSAQQPKPVFNSPQLAQSRPPAAPPWNLPNDPNAMVEVVYSGGPYDEYGNKRTGDKTVTLMSLRDFLARHRVKTNDGGVVWNTGGVVSVRALPGLKATKGVGPLSTTYNHAIHGLSEKQEANLQAHHQAVRDRLLRDAALERALTSPKTSLYEGLPAESKLNYSNATVEQLVAALRQNAERAYAITQRQHDIHDYVMRRAEEERRWNKFTPFASSGGGAITIHPRRDQYAGVGGNLEGAPRLEHLSTIQNYFRADRKRLEEQAGVIGNLLRAKIESGRLSDEDREAISKYIAYRSGLNQQINSNQARMRELMRNFSSATMDEYQRLAQETTELQRRMNYLPDINGWFARR